MARNTGLLGPSERALEFGAQYGEVLARWGELFVTASALVQANVRLGSLANESAKEFDGWLQQTSNAPWNWMNPENLTRFMESFAPAPALARKKE